MIDPNDKTIIHHLMGEDAFLEDAFSSEFYYISNPDGTIRWIFPCNLNKPMFLNFYSTPTIRSKILSYIFKLAFFFRQAGCIVSGKFKINVITGSRLSKILNKYEHTGFSIFTGTVGEDRKALLEIHDDKSTFVFIKIALSENSKKLVKNETTQLQFLNDIKFTRLVVPKVLGNYEDGIIELTNIKPASYQQNTKLTEQHVLALLELYSKSHTDVHTRWRELNALQRCKPKIKTMMGDYKIINLLDNDRVQRLSHNVLVLIEMLENEGGTLPLAIAHGDFTPWNMYTTDDAIYLFDWELSQNEMPMLFDLIHFVFQSETMINHSGYIKIQSELSDLLKTQHIKNLIINYKLDFNEHYIFYLAYNISHYLIKYVNQNSLHSQAFWLLDCWEDATNELLRNNGVVFH